MWLVLFLKEVIIINTALYLTPAEKYTAALGGLYHGELPIADTIYTKLLYDIINENYSEAIYKNIVTRFIYSIYISDLHDPYPRNNLAKLLYWKLHNIPVVDAGDYAEATISGVRDRVPLLNDLIKLWYLILFEDYDFAQLYDSNRYALRDSTGAYIKVLEV